MLICHGYHYSGFFSSIWFLFFTIFFLQTSYCTLPSSYSIFPYFPLFYVHCIFNFLLFFELFLYPTLIISLPPTLSKSFFFLFVTSYSFFLSYNMLIFFPPLLILAHLLFISQQWLGGIFAGVSSVCWVVQLCSGSSCTITYKM